jgi:2-polyprenyl-3-methyl-5-hydroxy-6-metoxy-1,4-benzoquinol methylase
MPVRAERLNIIEPVAVTSHREAANRILRGYPLLSRLYAVIRFLIIPQQFLDAIEQHLPARGTVLDIGCGFGLFTLYLAMKRPQCDFIGLDLSERRIAQAERAAGLLQLTNVQFICADLGEKELPTKFNAAYCLDLLHHLTPPAGDRLINHIAASLAPGGRIIIKDITTRPRLKLYFTFLLDLLMNPADSFYYRSDEVWRARLVQSGFISLAVYPLRNFLPYPHFMLVGQKPEAG